ncbi:hypothetical protein U9M48_022021 [Paspalum notatum var. saurae]|uniref:Uncharacterized protein n=1 Tax=Paspalum notatum var. saurae TaxID=547442 RepID=A0AAQ3TJ04_PASNO
MERLLPLPLGRPPPPAAVGPPPPAVSSSCHRDPSPPAAAGTPDLVIIWLAKLALKTGLRQLKRIEPKNGGKLYSPPIDLRTCPIYLHRSRRGRRCDRRRALFPLLPRHPVQLREHANHRGRVVRAGLRLHVVLPVVPEPVPPVRPSDDRADEHVGVGAPAAEPVVEPLRAADELLAVLVRHDGGGAVVHPVGVLGAVADEVADAPGVGAQHVVHLRPGEREHLLGGHGGAARARHGADAGLGQVVGVGGEQERGAGHVLHVVPLPDVEHPAGAALHVGVRAAVHVPAQARAHVPLCLLPVLLQRAPVARRVLPSQQQLKQDLDAGVLDVPAELVDGPAGAAEAVGLVDDVVQVVGPAGGAVEPEGGPQELVLVPAHRRVVALHLRDAAVVFAPVLVGELEQLQRYYSISIALIIDPAKVRIGSRC